MEESKEVTEPKAPNVSVLSTNLGMTEESVRRQVFNAHLGPDTKALIIEGNATGTVHKNLHPLIKEAKGKGVSVFVLSNNPGDDHGVKEMKYEAHMETVAAGAIPLKDPNINREAEVMNSIQEEIDRGRIGQELNDAIVKRFGTPSTQAAK